MVLLDQQKELEKLLTTIVPSTEMLHQATSVKAQSQCIQTFGPLAVLDI